MSDQRFHRERDPETKRREQAVTRPVVELGVEFSFFVSQCILFISNEPSDDEDPMPYCGEQRGMLHLYPRALIISSNEEQRTHGITVEDHEVDSSAFTWDEVQEATVVIDGPMALYDYFDSWADPFFTPDTAGLHQVRVSCRGRGTDTDEHEFDHPAEHYLFEIWPVGTATS